LPAQAGSPSETVESGHHEKQIARPGSGVRVFRRLRVNYFRLEQRDRTAGHIQLPEIGIRQLK
jgi:hypothetical protein